MLKTLEKRDIFILRRYLGTTRCHNDTQNFLKRKFDTSALKWRVTRVCWIAKTEIISKNKRTPKKFFRVVVTPLFFIHVLSSMESLFEQQELSKRFGEYSKIRYFSGMHFFLRGKFSYFDICGSLHVEWCYKRVSLLRWLLKPSKHGKHKRSVYNQSSKP